MQHTSTILGTMAVLVLAATGPVSAHELTDRADASSTSLVVQQSPEALEAAARARQAEEASTKGLGGGSPLVIPAAAFATIGNYDGTYRFDVFDGHMRGRSATDGCVQAPVYLPRRAEVTNLWASIIDEDSGADVFVFLKRSDNFAYHDADTMGTAHTSGSSNAIQTVFDESIQHADVEHPRYHYFVAMCLPSFDTRLYSVRIYFYDSEIFSDGFESGDSTAWPLP